MKKIAIVALIAASLFDVSPVHAMTKEEQCGSIADSVIASYNMAKTGVPMFEMISGVEDSFKRDRIPAKQIKKNMVNVRNLIRSGYMAYEQGLSQSATYEVAFGYCMNPGQSL